VPGERFPNWQGRESLLQKVERTLEFLDPSRAETLLLIDILLELCFSLLRLSLLDLEYVYQMVVLLLERRSGGEQLLL
jgi:hypothetical protein